MYKICFLLVVELLQNFQIYTFSVSQARCVAVDTSSLICIMNVYFIHIL